MAEINAACAGGSPIAAPEGQPGQSGQAAWMPGDEKAVKQIDIFPNPADQDVTVKIQGQYLWGRMQLFNANGQMIDWRVLEENDGKLSLDVSSLAPGLYLIQVYLDGQQFVKKLVVE